MKRLSAPWGENLEDYRKFYNEHPDLFDTYEEYKGHYCRRTIQDYNEIPRYACFLPWIKGHDVLDVGCDGGAMTDYLYRQGYHVVGLDITEEYITLNRERMPEIEWVLAAFEETEYCEEFDTLVCSEVLEHVMDVTAFLRVAYRALRPGGVFIGTVPMKGGRQESGRWYECDEHLSSFLPDEMSDLLSEVFSVASAAPVCHDQFIAFRAEK